jgi:hypothetical protein
MYSLSASSLMSCVGDVMVVGAGLAEKECRITYAELMKHVIA